MCTWMWMHVPSWQGQHVTRAWGGPAAHVRVCVLAGTFRLTLEFSEDYPNKAPVVKFKSTLFHPNGEAAGMRGDPGVWVGGGGNGGQGDGTAPPGSEQRWFSQQRGAAAGALAATCVGGPRACLQRKR